MKPWYELIELVCECGDVLSPKLTDDGKVYFYCIGCDVDYYVDKRVYHPEEVKP